MKRFLIMWLIGLAITACSPEGHPSDVAVSYLEAVDCRDWDKARSLSTPETGEILTLLAHLQPTKTEDQAHFEVLEENWQRDKGIAEVKVKKSKGAESTINLKVVDGKWLVHMPNPL